MSLLEILRAIGKRPLMYIGDPVRNRCSIWHLKSFFVGFQSGRFGRAEDVDFDFEEFNFWLCLRYRVAGGGMDWAGHLWKQSGEDDETAFRLFFELLDDYLKDREQLGPEVLKSRYIQMLADFRTTIQSNNHPKLSFMPRVPH